MALHFVIAGAALVGLFIAFLVLSRTIGTITNLLAKLEYIVSKDIEFAKETIAIRQAMMEEAERSRSREEQTKKEESEAASAPQPAAPEAKPAQPAPRPARPGRGGGKKAA